jgi:hypothetical protein
MEKEKSTQFNKIKTLRAIEDCYGTWCLEGSTRSIKKKNVFGHNLSSFVDIAEFKSLEECKIFCDLHMPNIMFGSQSFQDWYNHYYLI